MTTDTHVLTQFK